MEKEIEVQYLPPKPPIIIDCDEEQINQLLRNILGNALKFSDQHSRIEVVLTNQQGQAIIEVIDSGIGIPDDELEYVFSKFVQSSTTNSGAGGTGLGLAICREFVSLHDDSHRSAFRNKKFQLSNNKLLSLTGKSFFYD